MKKLSKVPDLFRLEIGDSVSKGNLFDLIQYSKQENSEYWSGKAYSIGNTPQQGINWIGEFPDLHGVIIKSKSEDYGNDGWQDEKRNLFSYSFKARNGKVNKQEKANRCLIDQSAHGYPVLLFVDVGGEWEYNGAFEVKSTDDTSVLLDRVEGKAFKLARTEAVRLTGGSNVIYYGAPGTGKSWKIDSIVEEKGGSVFRTVFHPDVQNSDFIGTLKPVIKADHVGYAFSPGPFAKAYVDAVNNPERMTWLIIEELNRAPAAAVFGELFLLLDRDETGNGIYDVDCPSEEFGKWLVSMTGDHTGKLRLPSNLSILCTMNSADLGVYPLDTAFRRRWYQCYVALDYDIGPDKEITINLSNGQARLKWLDFIKALNTLLSDHSIPEDRLIGPWFIKPSEFDDNGKVPEKLLIYLWDDLLRAHGRNIVFRSALISTYGELLRLMDTGKPVFSTELEAVLV